ncbi:MAG: type II toxin-antitoxin system RelE/ParE family toxin [Chloroflexi bacterium]|nr:type II toxin-antitoxin system RelE/ParE family toxin [Chloroflexota bacterium]
MASYSVILKPSVEKDLRALPKLNLARVIRRIEQLRTEPITRQALKLSGAEQLYRVRVGDYRIIYEVDSQRRQILVHYVRHRREAYRGL